MSEIVVKVSDTSQERAVKILHSGGLVAIPTETVYGLGCDATNRHAVAKLYAAKGRPSFNPLISHVSNIDAAQLQGEFNTVALKLAKLFWPGPLTIVLPFRKNGTVCDLARAGLNTIAIRIPSHDSTRKLLEYFSKPVVAPSANISGRISPTLAEHVFHDIGDKVDLILDGGPSSKGIESTVIDCTDERPRLLRLGALALGDLESHVGELGKDTSEGNTPISPGQLLKHYAPTARLRLNVITPRPNEALLGFGKTENATLNLSVTGNLTEAAANLFAMLRELDKSYDEIAIVPIPNEGLGEAINDRLSRASNTRS